MTIFLIASFVLSISSKLVLSIVMDKTEQKYFWATKGKDVGEVVFERHLTEMQRYKDMRTGLTYIAFFSAIAFAVEISFA